MADRCPGARRRPARRGQRDVAPGRAGRHGRRWPTPPASRSPTTRPGPDRPAWSASSPRPTSRAAPPGWRCGPTRSRSASTARSRRGSAPGVPAAYVAEVEPETGWFTLLLEDIVGAAPGRPDRRLRRPDVAAAVLEEMAGLHAPCWEAPDLAAPRVAQPGHARVGRAPRACSCPRCCRDSWSATRTPWPPITRRSAASSPSTCRPTCELRSGPRTASHGDFRLDNLLFQPGDARPVVVDWQTVAWAAASYDVAYFIGGCLSAEDRRAHEQRPPGPLPRRPLPARRARLLLGAAARRRPAGHLRRRA